MSATAAESFKPNWKLGTKSGLVSVNDHSDKHSLVRRHIWLSTTGPDRRPPNGPVVLIIPGVGCSTAGWAAVIRQLSTFVRVCCYERAGYGRSDPSTGNPSSINIVRNLNLLLESAAVGPPYIIVAHSWAGILAREFIRLRHSKADVAGIVFVDANQESTLQVADWRCPALARLSGGLDLVKVTGLDKSNKLTPEEWRFYLNEMATEQHQKQAARELQEYETSFDILAEKKQLNRTPPFLDHCPVYVIRGRSEIEFQRLLDENVRLGRITDDQKAEADHILRDWPAKNERLQREILTLSSCGRYVEAERSGHSVQLTEPDVIVEGVKWVLEHSKQEE